MSYKHLNFEQHCKIAAFWKAGYFQKEIAAELGVSPSTISRELKRNSRFSHIPVRHESAPPLAAESAAGKTRPSVFRT